MNNKLLTLAFLISTVAGLRAQGICDSTISIAPIQPLCQGTGEGYLQVSHPGGVFSGPGLIYNNEYLDAENLAAGFYTAKYTITGPGGCTVQATRQFEVRAAQSAFASASGMIDCSNPNATVMIQAYLQNAQNYWGGAWDGPPGSNVSIYNDFGTTGYAGTYRYYAYPINFNDCPAFAHLNVGFANNQTPVQIVSCTDCNEFNGFPPLRIKIDPVPPGWQATLTAPNGAHISNAGNCTAVSSFFPSGSWMAEIINSQNGCRSTKSAYLNTEYPRPSVSAGSDLRLWCGGTGHLLPAMGPTNAPGFNYFWTRPDGSAAPAAYGELFPVTEPGMYVLHGVNTFTGCEDLDTSFVFPPITPVKTQISVICDGESLNGHTEPGSYVDTIALANGCIKVELLKLIVLAPIQDSVVVVADNGQMSGSIDYLVTQGWPPFSYNWSTGDVTASISNLSAGEYTVTVTDANNCQHQRTILVPAGRPLRKLTDDRTMPAMVKANLYPNPATAGLVKCTLQAVFTREAGEATLLVNDVLGRTVSSQVVSIQEGSNVISWTDKLAEGVYTLFLKGSFGLKEVSKLVVIDAK